MPIEVKYKHNGQMHHYQIADSAFDAIMEMPPTSFHVTDHGTYKASSYAKIGASLPPQPGDPVYDLAKTAYNEREEIVDRARYIEAAEQTLIDGADYMERVGWTAGMDRDQHGRVCLRGAVCQQQVAYAPSFCNPVQRLALDLVVEHLGLDPIVDSAMAWNDRQRGQLGDEVPFEIAQKEVIKTMRDAVDTSRRSRGETSLQ